jgi:hypothetical protein
MSPMAQFIAGVVFAALCLLFLVMAFRMKGTPNAMQQDIVNFICALCAGAAGGFFTGTAVLSYNWAGSPGNALAFQGTAGVALFALVFLLMRSRTR